MVKYKTETYIRHHAYTSYPNLDLAQDKAIQDSCYDNLPKFISTHLGNVDIYDDYQEFLPVNEAYENPGKVWQHNKKSDWYTHVYTGVKVKKEVIKSANYDSPNGNGSCTTTLTIKIPQPSERGKNPNSHNNRKIPGLVSKDVRLTEEQWQTVEKMGNGRGYSQGVRNLLERFEAV